MEDASTIASRAIWLNLTNERFAVLTVGLSLTVVGLCVFCWIALERLNSAVSLGQGEKLVPLHHEHTNFMLTTGLVELLCGAVSMCAPEFQPIASVFETLYKCVCIHALSTYIVLRFGGPYLMFQKENSGTFQQCEKGKVWAAKGFCCCWMLCFPCMKNRNLIGKDLRIIKTLLVQYFYVGPVMSAVPILLNFEGAEQLTKNAAFAVCNVIGTVSMVLALYGITVLTTVADKCPDLRQQSNEWQAALFAASDGEVAPTGVAAAARDVEGTSGMATQRPESLEMAPKTSKNKFSKQRTWISAVSALPSIALLICIFAIQGDIVQDDGSVLREIDRERHWAGFVTIIVAFLFIIAIPDVFPFLDTRQIISDAFASIELGYKHYSDETLHHLMRLSTEILIKRGSDVLAVSRPGKKFAIAETQTHEAMMPREGQKVKEHKGIDGSTQSSGRKLLPL
eukprot:TRINITY_DN27858_c0_g1_i1.p1 TRINITY_DN27858_c0_g1~~TRINITY_DN27858_c0_g1_i1.p1  ORF type:complete len:453 (-),score=57.26 TRINITY_DN27858_c0_g1_i1:52-1410(-)